MHACMSAEPPLYVFPALAFPGQCQKKLRGSRIRACVLILVGREVIFDAAVDDFFMTYFMIKN
jgi:hypothetical protein